MWFAFGLLLGVVIGVVATISVAAVTTRKELP